MNEELKIIIKAQTEQAKKNIEGIKETLKDVGTKTVEVGKKIGTALATVGKATATAFKAVGTAVAAGAAAITGLAESTREYRESQAKLIASFEATGKSVESAKGVYNDLYRVIGDTDVAVEAAQQISLFAKSEEEAAKWAGLASGVVATFGDALTPETFYEAANETLSLGEATGAYTQMLEQAHMDVEAFNAKLAACNTETEKQALVLSVAEEAMGSAGAAYEKNAKALLDANAAQAALTDNFAKLGAAAEPIVTILKGGLASALATITPHIETVASGLTDMLNGVEGGAEKMEKGISDLMNGVVDIIVKALPTVVTVGVQIITSLLNGVISALPSVVTAIVEAIPQLITGIVDAFGAIVDALPTIIETIVQALPTLIPALIDGIITMVVTLAENFSAIIQPIIDALPDIIISLVDALMSNLPSLIDGLIALIMGIVQAIPQIIQALVDALPTVISLIIEGLLSCLPQIIGGLIQVVWGIIKALPQIFGSLIQGVVNILAGIWDGLEKVFGKVGSWFGEKFSGAVKSIKNAFSGVANFFSGVWNSIKNIFSKIGSTIADAISGAVKKAINAVLSTATKIINGFISAINFAIDIINKIPGVNIKKLASLSVPKMAKGGIVDSATLAVIGEQGKEAVLPLENNIGWMEKLADMLNERMGGNTPIILKVGEKVFGEICIDSINGITKQTGSLPLVIG